jgi:hypothetical protein
MMSDKETVTSTDPTADVLIELRSRADALERQLAEVQRQTEARVIRAELKAEAVRAGIVDPDGLKLLDTSNAKLNKDGEVEGADALIAELKRAKPWLFGGFPSSSSSAIAPPAMPPRQKLATDMTDSEWRTARAALRKRRS